MRLNLKRIAVMLMFVCSGCSNGRVEKPPVAVTAQEKVNRDEEVELAPYMANLQRYSQKLGLAVTERNQDLVAFYIEELEESAEKLAKDVPEHDGIPIAASVETFLVPSIDAFEHALKDLQWRRLNAAYTEVIASCNRCHAATGHEFIVITPQTGSSPFNQDFKPKKN